MTFHLGKVVLEIRYRWITMESYPRIGFRKQVTRWLVGMSVLGFARELILMVS